MFWGERPPAEAKAAIQTHISALRRLTTPGLILTEGYGYRLSTDDVELDVASFDHEAATARMEAVNRNWEAAHEAASRGLALWRTSPYPDLADDHFARPEIVRLEETHLALWELWAESLIALGRPAEALPELERLIVENPYREHLWEHLMTTRYQMGRNAEALRAFRQLTDHLAESGLEPGPSIRRLEEKILFHERDLKTPPHNLSAGLTSFVGRDVEMVEVADLLDGHRLVTLTGAAGSGKTRLAIQVAESLLASFPDGVWFVGLADLTDPELIPLEILRVLGGRPSGGDPLDDVTNAIRHETSLFILDNCEHLLEGAATVVERLTTAGDGVRVLATSREPLHVSGEVAYEVLPLEVPPDGATMSEVPDFDAVRLFLDRATSADPRLRVGPDNLAIVARISRRLDGIPLPIELAAAKVRSFSLETLDGLLGSDLKLTGEPRAVSRHSSVDAAIGWSFDLLDETEKAVFLGLAVFRGGFDVDMARQVAGSGMDPDRFIDVFGGLVDKSLVSKEKGGSPRYRLLEPVREFARAQLETLGMGPEARGRHLGWCVSFAAEVEREMFSPGRHLLLDRLGTEADNLQAGFDQASADGDQSAVSVIAGAFAWHWSDVGSATRARDALRVALDAAGDDLARRVELLARLSQAEFALGDVDDSVRSAVAAHDLGRNLPPSPQQVVALLRLSSSYSLMLDEDPRRGVELAREALGVAEASGNVWMTVRSRTALGSALSWSGEVDESLEILEQALDEALETDDPVAIIDVYNTMLTPLYLHPGRRRTGPPRLVEDLLEKFPLESWSRHIEHGWIPYVFLQSGEWDRAEASISVQQGSRRMEGYDRNSYLMTWGTLCWMRGDLAAAAEAIAELESGGVNPRWYHDFYPLCADIAADSGDLERVRQLAETYLTVEVDPTEAAKKLGVLNPLVRAEVDAALDATDDERDDHGAHAERAVARMAEILEEFPPHVEGSVAMETHDTHLAFARAELSRIDAPDPDLWRKAADRADYLYFRLYALIRLGEAMLGRGDLENGASTLDDARDRAKEVGAAGLVRLADRISAGVG
jgi:predicted ATPase/DNA-binding SARP family transcriptional activator